MKVAEKDIFVGCLVKAFGIRGELKLHPSDDFWESLLASKRLVLHVPSQDGFQARSVAFSRSRPHGRNYVVKIDGVEDRNAAESLVGAELFIAEDEIDVARPDHMLPYQVVGMKVESEDGEVLGEVSSVMYSAAHDIYEVKSGDGSFLVPAIPEFIVSVDEARRALVLRPMPGLIEDLAE